MPNYLHYSVQTLKNMRQDLLAYARDVIKDAQLAPNAALVQDVFTQIVHIDEAIKELGG